MIRCDCFLKMRVQNVLHKEQDLAQMHSVTWVLLKSKTNQKLLVCLGHDFSNPILILLADQTQVHLGYHLNREIKTLTHFLIHFDLHSYLKYNCHISCPLNAPIRTSELNFDCLYFYHFWCLAAKREMTRFKKTKL